MILPTSTLAVIGTPSTSNLNSPPEKKTKRSSKETCELEATITHINNHRLLQIHHKKTTPKEI